MYNFFLSFCSLDEYFFKKVGRIRGRRMVNIMTDPGAGNNIKLNKKKSKTKRAV